MLFNSYIFILLFLPASLIGFTIANRYSPRHGVSWLVVCSILFYGYWNPPYVLVLLGSIFANYLLGKRVQFALKNNNSTASKKWLVIGISANLLLLAYYKYTNFFLSSLNSVALTDYSMGEILLPIGISFYTFTQIAFLVDCYRGFVSNYKLTDYVLFVSFFPQLIAGPILHHKEIVPQLTNRKKFTITKNSLAVGSSYFIIGLFKKAVLADGIAPYANPLFESSAAGVSPDFFLAWGGTLAYTLQLYFDFSGYSDMAIGLCLMFGVTIPFNFNSPYKAQNISEFWRCWHMTLSRFLRDYLYIPLGGNRCGPIRNSTNLLLTMLIGGLWHGAGWNFVVWGGLHGLYLSMHRLYVSIVPSKLRLMRSIRLFSWFLTFLAVVFAWVFFRATSFESAILILHGMVGSNAVEIPTAIFNGLAPLHSFIGALGIQAGNASGSQFIEQWLWVIGLLSIALFFPNSQQIMKHALDSSSSDSIAQTTKICWRPNLTWALLIGTMASVSFLSLAKVSEFLYFQF